VRAVVGREALLSASYDLHGCKLQSRIGSWPLLILVANP
jgi:hypothetical protein